MVMNDMKAERIPKGKDCEEVSLNAPTV